MVLNPLPPRFRATQNLVVVDDPLHSTHRVWSRSDGLYIATPGPAGLEAQLARESVNEPPTEDLVASDGVYNRPPGRLGSRPSWPGRA